MSDQLIKVLGKSGQNKTSYLNSAKDTIYNILYIHYISIEYDTRLRMSYKECCNDKLWPVSRNFQLVYLILMIFFKN